MAERPVHILIPTERFWPEYTGWIKQTLTMASECRNELRFTAVSRPSDVETDESLPVNVARCSVGADSDKSGFYLKLQYVFFALAYIVRYRRRIDVIYLPYVFFPGFIFITVGVVLGIPTVARISGQEVDRNPSLAAKLRKWSLRTVNAVIALNHRDIHQLEKLGVDSTRVFYIPNGVDTTRFSPVAIEKQKHLCDRLGLPAERPVIAFAGIVCRRKGVQELLEAFEAALEQTDTAAPRPYLVLAGPVKDVEEVDTAYINQVRSQIRGLSGDISMPGKINNVPELFRASDIFVLPSYAEGMPNVLLEAMATGLSCIATKIPGIVELIDSGENGILIAPRDSEPLRRALLDLLRDPQERNRLGNKARETIVENFSIKGVASQYRRLFHEVLNEVEDKALSDHSRFE